MYVVWPCSKVRMGMGLCHHGSGIGIRLDDFVVTCTIDVQLFHPVSLGNRWHMECWEEQHGVWIQQRDMEPRQGLCGGESLLATQRVT